jgi:protein phosphatase
MTLEARDIVLLCTDGLTDVVSDTEILETLRAQPDLKTGAEALVDLANHRGGPDNITVVLLEMPDWAAGAQVKNGPASRRRH